MALVTFYQIFRVIDDKTLEFIHRTRVGDVVFDAGAPLAKGVVIGGIDFFKYLGNDMEVDEESDGTRIVRRVYV